MNLARKTVSFGLAFSFTLLCGMNAVAKNNPGKIIDSFNSTTGWERIGSELNIINKKGVKGNCICIDYNLVEGSNYVVISKKFPEITLPENYEFTFYIKGDSPVNNLEFKLIDKNGNVYWKKWDNFVFPEDWQKTVVRKRGIAFGWGPNPDKKLEKVDKIEFGISRGTGGSGKVLIDELSLGTSRRTVPASKMKATSSSPQEEHLKASYAIDGNMQTRWSSNFSDPQWLQIDFGETRQIVGVTLHWETAYGKSYDILLSKDSKDWITAYTTTEGDGLTDDIYFKKTSARYLKIFGKKRGTAWGYSLWEVELKGADEEPVVTASSSLKKCGPENILDGSMETKWQSDSNNKQWIEIDLRKVKSFGGLFLYWGDNYAKSYEISISADKRKWKTIHKTTDGNGSADKIYFERNSARFIKINLNKGANGNGYVLKDITIKGPDETLTPQKYYEVLAEELPRGYFPRWIYNEQAFWTVVGVEEDYNESLLCEDASIEPYKGGFSIIPFLYLDEKLITWADVKLSQALEKDYLPIPSATWSYEDLSMEVKIFAHGKAGESITYARYNLENKGSKTVDAKLFLTIRPFQINPPWQPGGGLANVRKIEYYGNNNPIVNINDSQKICLLTKPDGFGVSGYKEGDVVNTVRYGKVPAKRVVSDKDGYATGAVEYQFKLKPGESKSFFIAMPLHNKMPALNARMKQQDISSGFEKMLKEVASFWESKVNRVKIDIPAPDIVNTLRSNIAYILINKDGPAIQPGSRTYEHAWIRDGSMTSAALLRMGINQEVKEYLDWYSGFLEDDGRVPAIINNDKGRFTVNPLKEYDSQGEMVFAILQYYYFTKEKEFLRAKLPVVTKALEYLESIRNQRTTPEYRDASADKRRFYGILPNSVSHEGYFPEPGMHSYWDDFFGIKAWKDGKKIAEILGRKDLLKWIDRQGKALSASVYESIDLVMDYKNIDYIPGCAEKGDFDATSTAIAIMICDELDNLPDLELRNTFDKYYNDLLGRFNPDWVGGFTPYEVRSVQAFIYMDQKERALTLLKYLLDCRRPLKWNHLAEVVFSNPRLAQYIGDMPHTWVGSGYINAVRSMFAYEKDNSLIIAHGIPEEWLSSKNGISIGRLPTYYGSINYTMKKDDGVVKVKVWGNVQVPGNIVVKNTLSVPIKTVEVNGKRWKEFSKDEVTVKKLPADIIIQY